MTDQAQGPIYEYMMGTFDLHDATWMTSMNDMLNNFGLAGWKRSVATLLDARHLLVVMERRWPSAVEYAGSQPKADPVPQADDDYDAVAAGYRETKAAIIETERLPEVAADPLHATDRDDEASEYDDEAEAMMAAKVAEVIPWAARPKAPANGRRKGARGPQRKKVAIPARNKAAT